MKTKHILVAVLANAAFHLAVRSQWIPQSIPSPITTLLTVDVGGTGIGAAGGYQMTFDFWGRAIYTTDGGGTWALA